MVRKKNLTKENIEDVSTYEDYSKRKFSETNQQLLDRVQIKIKCLNERQKQIKRLIEEKDIVIVNGPSGVGKTYLALLVALHLLKTEPKYSQLTLLKSVQPIKNENLGFIPGDVQDKIAPAMRSYVGNLNKIFGNKTTLPGLAEAGIVQFDAITYMRGVNIDNQICIIDETQNIDYGTFKTIITRLGKNSKFIFLGDEEQIDMNDKNRSCLSKICKIFSDNKYIGVVDSFSNSDCVRHELIPIILEILRNNGI